jgi:biopolymer transport protein TolR
MAGAAAPAGKSGKGRKKNLNFDLNLTPFVDILAMTICFLLMSAVWIQIGMMPVKQSHGTEGGAAADSLDISLKFKGVAQIDLALTKKGKTVQKAALSANTMEELLPKLDATVSQWLKGITPSNAPATFKPGSLVGSGMVTPKSGVSYGDLVAAMDVLRHHDIVNLGVVPVKEN